MAAQEDKLSDAERAAVKQRAGELRKQASRKGGAKKDKDRQDVVDTIAGPDGQRQGDREDAGRGRLRGRA